MKHFNPEDLPSQRSNGPTGLNELPPELQHAVIKRSEIYKFEKKDLLLDADECSTDAYYITSGLVMCYVPKDGQNIVNWVRGEGAFALAQTSANRSLTIEKQMTGQIMVALEETIAIKFSFEDLKWLQDQFPQMKGIIQTFLVMYVGKAHHLATNERLLLKDKYMQLEEHVRFKLDRVPDIYLASWLGVSLIELKEFRYSRR